MANTTIIEVNGVKLEVDLRVAKRIETLRVGSRVKVLTKEYQSTKVHPGVVVGFEPFNKKPTILIAYVNINWSDCELKIVSVNEDSKDIEVVASIDDEIFAKTDVTKLFDRQIAEAQRKVDDLEEKKSYFLRNFATYWAPVEMPTAKAEEVEAE